MKLGTTKIPFFTEPSNNYSPQRHLLENARSQGVGDVIFSAFFKAP